MLSDRNPMKNPETYRKSRQKALIRQKSKFEESFHLWMNMNGLNAEYTGNATMWVVKRNPDFRVSGQKKAIELTQPMCFRGKRILRFWDDYGKQTVEHYRKYKWQCLVVFLKQSQRPSPDLLKTLKSFSETDQSWSGVWNYDRLILC